ncbi:hypothetical protein [Actinomadura coerulea]|uniref:hypothetical protein n=1 Tax=Actinomadura coerulea TaxID=46159 RepID=UPI00342D0203
MPWMDEDRNLRRQSGPAVPPADDELLDDPPPAPPEPEAAPQRPEDGRPLQDPPQPMPASPQLQPPTGNELLGASPPAPPGPGAAPQPPEGGGPLQDPARPLPTSAQLQPLAQGGQLDDLADLTPEQAAGLGSDPRVAAAFQRPENIREILARQAQQDPGPDGRGKNPYGGAALLGGSLNIDPANNPIGLQRALGAAAQAAQAAEDVKSPPAGSPSEQAAAGAGAGAGVPTSKEALKKAAGDLAKDKLRQAAEERGLGGYIPDIPEQGDWGDKALNLLGQGVDIGGRAWSDRAAPGAYDAVKDSDAGGGVLDDIEASRIGQKIPRSFWDGFRRRQSTGQTKSGAGQNKEKADGSGKDKQKGRGKLVILLAVALPVVAAFLSILLLASLLLGVDIDGDDAQAQPEDKSNVKVAEYLPGDWMEVLKKASERTSGNAQDYSEVPWTILGGLVKAQTDFARYSPYDNIDRDPGRKSKDVPGGTGSGDGSTGGVDVNASNTVGAGPGPVQGVSGPGSTATVPGTEPGHTAPPDGDFSHQLGWFLWALRMQESGGVYDRNAGTNQSTACGAYQYITSTWRDGGYTGGYARACLAPPSVQDRRAKEDVIKMWNTFHKWQSVAVQHFTGSWGNQPERWNSCPGACDFNPTAWKYADGVMKKMQDAARAHPATSSGGTPGAVQPASYNFQPAPTPPSGSAEPIAADPLTPEPITPEPTDPEPSSPGPSSPEPSSPEPGSPGPTSPEPAAPQPGVPPGMGGNGPGDTSLWGCTVAAPKPGIGGKKNQGSGPYLLTPAAAGQMIMRGMNPQSPCDSSYFVAFQLVRTAEKVHRDPKSPPWRADGNEKDQENARKYWSKVIASSGLFMERTANPGGACAVPPPDDPDKPWSVSFRIITIWRCETNRIQELYLVTGAKPDGAKYKYSVQTDRAAAVETLVNEAMSVSYGAGGWKTEGCDDRKNSRQGIFPMTREEAEEAGVEDRCDVDKNIAGAAKLVLSVETVPPGERPHDLGSFQPMIGGWQKLSVAMGTDLTLFSLIGPGQNGFEASDKCIAVMRKFLTDIAPHAEEFASLKEPPDTEKVYGDWEPKLEKLEKAHNITDPGSDPACMIGSWAPGYNNTLAQIAADLAGNGTYSTNLNGLGNYYQGREEANKETPPVVGEDTLVIPRLALRPLKPVGAPIAPDATEAWTRLSNTQGVQFPLEQVAVEYAWFFGGVIPPFNSAGKLIGSIANGGGSTMDTGTVQVTVGPDGCPENAPNNTLRQGSKEIGIRKLCEDSVKQARTPQAAMAIKWALTHLGWIYTQNTDPSAGPTRNSGNSADCSSFVSRAYRDSKAIPNLFRGNAPTTHTLRQVSWTHKISFNQLKPGDLVEPTDGHVAMQLADGYKVHTNTHTDVSRVERAYDSAYWAGWVDASKV